MCYYNGIRVSRLELIRLMQLEMAANALLNADIAIRNGFEYTDWPIVKPLQGGANVELVMAHWEYIGPWLKNWEDVKASRKKGKITLNARAENLFINEYGKPAMWSDAALHRRCLVLSSEFYEWRTFKPATSKKDIKYPYRVSLPDREYFYMAGLWGSWTDQDTGETIDTFAIVTTDANSLMKQVHYPKGRMPTILPDNLALDWLQDGLTKDRIEALASYQLSAELMEAHTVIKDFRTMEEPNTPFKYEELPELH